MTRSQRSRETRDNHLREGSVHGGTDRVAAAGACGPADGDPTAPGRDNLTDGFWVGRIGADAVTALSFSWPLLFLFVSIGAGMTNAGTILVAQHAGAGNDDRLGRVAGGTIAFVGLLSVAVSVVGVVLAPVAIRAIGAIPGTAVHELAVACTRVVLGMPFTFGFHVFMALLRGWGDTRTPMYLMVLGVGLNVVLDPFLILGFADNPLLGGSTSRPSGNCCSSPGRAPTRSSPTARPFSGSSPRHGSSWLLTT